MPSATPSEAITQFRPIALARDFEGLRQAFRARCDELRVARVTVDEIGGLSEGQCSKLLALVRDQEMGPISFPAMLGALGLAVLVVEDAEAMARIRHRLKPRDERYAANASVRRASDKKRGKARVAKGDREWGRIMNARRSATLSDRRRKQIARAAARARWRRLPAKASP